MMTMETLRCGESISVDSVLKAEGKERHVVVLTKRYARFDPPLMVRRPIGERTPENRDTDEVPLELISRNIEEGFWKLVK